MIQIPTWLLKLDVMSQMQVDVMQFLLSAFIIATLAVLILSQPQEAALWKFALIICIVLTTIGMIVAFTPPPFTKYASLFRNWGVLIMLIIATILRFQKTEGWALVRVGKYNLVLYATLGVAIMGILATPFFTVVNSQEQVQSKQNNIIGLLFNLFTEVRTLNAKLDRDHFERLDQHKRDSTERAGIHQAVNTIRVDVHQGLVNDINVKRALGKTKTTTTRLYIDVPKPTSVPRGNFSQPSTDRVKPVDAVNRRGRKISYADSLRSIDGQSEHKPVAKLYEF